MTGADIPLLEARFSRDLGIRVYLEASRGRAAPKGPWPGLREALERFGDPARSAAWLRGRAALERLLERVAADGREGAVRAGAEEAAPVIPEPAAVRFPHPFLSLTHTQDWALAAGTEPGAARGTGVDLELRTGMREGAERFFLTEAETRWLLSRPQEARGRERVRLWTVKEALYKADPSNDGALLGHYQLEDPGAVAGTARRRGDPDARFLYACAALDPGALSVAVGPCAGRA